MRAYCPPMDALTARTEQPPVVCLVFYFEICCFILKFDCEQNFIPLRTAIIAFSSNGFENVCMHLIFTTIALVHEHTKADIL